MKTTFSVRNAAIAFFTVLNFTAFVPVAGATEDPKASGVELKFLGNFRSKPVFELQFNSPAVAGDYLINIRDQFGNSLYREVMKSKILSKKFMLNTDEIEDDFLRFEVTNRKDNSTVVYEINRNSHVVEDVLISKLN
jgi:hypothetical protein